MNLFLNKSEDRLRAGWRLLLQFALFLVFSILFMGLLSMAYRPAAASLQSYLVGAAALLSIWICGRYLDKRRFSGFGFRLNALWTKEFLLGTGIAAAAMAFIFLIQLASGWIEYEGWGWNRASETPFLLSFLSYLGGMLTVGLYEEAIFRGYQIKNMAEGFAGKYFAARGAILMAVVLSSLVFGLLHAGNPNAGLISTFNIILAGGVLALPFILTGSLSLSVGIHFSWNFFQGGVFGFPVSGMPNRSSVFQIRQGGPEWMTGGAFGPEAGLLGIFGLILITGCIILYTHRSPYYNFSVHSSFLNKNTGREQISV